MRGMATTNALEFPVTSALEVIRGAAFRDDESLFEELAELAAPGFQNAVPLLKREWNRCDTLYLLYDESWYLAGFSLVNFAMLKIEGRHVPTLFSGLSALLPHRNQSERANFLFAASLADAMDWEEAEEGARLVIWGATATPTVYLEAWEALADVNPRPNGSYAPEAVPLARSLRCHYRGTESQSEHPFVLRGVARDALYHPLEAERLEQICRLKELPLFGILGVDRAEGDRVLFAGHLPRDSDPPISSVWQLAMRLRKERMR